MQHQAYGKQRQDMSTYTNLAKTKPYLRPQHQQSGRNSTSKISHQFDLDIFRAKLPTRRHAPMRLNMPIQAAKQPQSLYSPDDGLAQLHKAEIQEIIHVRNTSKHKLQYESCILNRAELLKPYNPTLDLRQSANLFGGKFQTVFSDSPNMGASRLNLRFLDSTGSLPDIWIHPGPQYVQMFKHAAIEWAQFNVPYNHPGSGDAYLLPTRMAVISKLRDVQSDSYVIDHNRILLENLSHDPQIKALWKQLFGIGEGKAQRVIPFQIPNLRCFISYLDDDLLIRHHEKFTTIMQRSHQGIYSPTGPSPFYQFELSQISQVDLTDETL